LKILASGGLYGLYVMLSALCLFAMRHSMFLRYVEGFWTEVLFCRVSFVYSLVVLFSLFSIFTLYYSSYKTRFFHIWSREPRFFEKCRFVLTAKEFWLQMGVVIGLIVIFPTRPAFSSLITGFFHGNGFVPSPLVEKLIVTAIAVPLFLLIGFMAHMSTVNWWARQKKSSDDGRFHPFKAARQLLFSMVLYVIAAIVLSLVYPAIFFTLYQIIRTFFWQCVVLVIVLFFGFWGIVIGRIIHKRRRFIKRLQLICKDHHFHIKQKHSLYAAMLSAKDGYDFSVDTDRGMFCCKLVPSLSRKNNLFFHDEGMVSYTSSLMNVILHTVSQPYTFDANGKKIIIVNPVSNRLYAANSSEKRLLEIGDVVMDYSIHTASSFLSALDRGCL
jgi:hypothetical protein